MDGHTEMSTKTRTSMRDKAYQNFSDLLLNSRIQPGQFLTQKELVEITDMSLSTVRELIPRLEADGLIRAIPQRGLQVTHIDLNLIKNAFELRLILEKRAIAHFTEFAEQALIERLLDEHQTVLAAAENGADKSLLEKAQLTDWEFHDTIIDFLDNEIISKIYRVNSIKIRLIISEKTRISPFSLTRVFSEHLKILNAVEARDVQAAEVALEEHILSAKKHSFETSFR